MSYINITNASTTLARDYVNSNWVASSETTFIKKHVLARAAHLALVPASFITSAVDTIIGLGVGIGVICTLGKHESTFKITRNHLFSSNRLFVRPYVNLLQTINPEANFSGSNGRSMISAEGVGFLSDFSLNLLMNIARDCYNSDNFLKRHVFSRLTYVLLAVACLVTRAVDGIIGIPVAGLSILTGGKFESLNNLAYRTLQATGIIEDLFCCTIRFINPLAGTAIA